MKTRIFRWLLAIGAWVFCAFQFRDLLNSGGGYGGFPFALFGFAGLITGILLVSPEIVQPICGSFADFFLGFIYPGERATKPPLTYLLARRYRDQKRTTDSIVEYLKILHYYPNERDAYREMLALALELGDERFFRKHARRYRRKFGEPFDASTMLPPPQTEP
jgi:hypothetical protein